MDDVEAVRQRLQQLIDDEAPIRRVLDEADMLLGRVDWDASLFAEVGVHASDSSELDRAIKYFQRAIDLRPAHAKYHYDLGVAYNRSEQPGPARFAYEEALARLPYLTDAFFNLAWCYIFLGDLPAAALTIDKVINAYGAMELPQKADRLLSCVAPWLHSGSTGKTPPTVPQLLTAGLSSWGEDFSVARAAFSDLAALLPAVSAGWAIAKECAATAASQLDLHDEYLDGCDQRRVIVRCAQALVPEVVTVNYAEAAADRDVTAACNAIVRVFEPGHEDELVLWSTEGFGPRGAGTRTASLFGTAGMYQIVPIGNIIEVTTPDAATHQLYDWTGDMVALCTV
ncbi:tetratricopeptide repeat protein [Streptomyces olivaceiscleroticus]|uniref:Tetratricopeptide repeat protein n=1 Tax=Streptomyces olivaceiscleroticus TaxID=68245 RepID=A0ABP3JFQ2_9ACTN